MPEIIMLCGPCGCGKTTYAKTLQARGNTFVLSSDDLMLTLFDACIGRERHQDMERRCRSFLLRQAESLFALGLDVVLDFGFWNRKERLDTKQYFCKRGIPVRLIVLDAPYEIITRHLEQRNRLIETGKLRAYPIDEEKRKRFSSWFEEPTPDEIDEYIHIVE